jgi:hypothetical protein
MLVRNQPTGLSLMYSIIQKMNTHGSDLRLADVERKLLHDPKVRFPQGFGLDVLLHDLEECNLLRINGDIVKVLDPRT